MTTPPLTDHCYWSNLLVKPDVQNDWSNSTADRHLSAGLVPPRPLLHPPRRRGRPAGGVAGGRGVGADEGLEEVEHVVVVEVRHKVVLPRPP